MANERANEFLSWRAKLSAPDGVAGQGLDDKEQSWQRLAERLQKRPRRHIAWLVAAACIILALFPVTHLLRDRPGHPTRLANRHAAANSPIAADRSDQRVPRPMAATRSDQRVPGATVAPLAAAKAADPGVGGRAVGTHAVGTQGFGAERVGAPPAGAVVSAIQGSALQASGIRQSSSDRTLARLTRTQPVRKRPFVAAAIVPDTAIPGTQSASLTTTAPGDLVTGQTKPGHRTPDAQTPNPQLTAQAAATSAGPARFTPRRQLRIVCYNEIGRPAAQPPVQAAVRESEPLRITLGRLPDPGSGDPMQEEKDYSTLTIRLIPQNH